MPSNLNFDQRLLDEALHLSGLKYKKDVVNLALSEFVNKHKQMSILKLFNTISYDDEYDYKKGRKKR